MQVLVYLMLCGFAAASVVGQLVLVSRTPRDGRDAPTSRPRVVLDWLVVVFLLAVMRAQAVTALTQVLWLVLVAALAVAVAVAVYRWPRIPRRAAARPFLRENG